MRQRLLTLADVRSDVPALDVRKLFGDDYDLIRRRRDAVARFKKNAEHVRLLVEKFSELARIRGELIARWDDLRPRRNAFERAHSARIVALKASIAGHERTFGELAEQVVDPARTAMPAWRQRAVCKRSWRTSRSRRKRRL